MGNLLTLLTFNKAFNSWKSLVAELRNPKQSGQNILKAPPWTRKMTRTRPNIGKFYAIVHCQTSFCEFVKNWGEEAAMPISAWGLGLIHILHIQTQYQYIISRFKTVAFTQKRVNTQDESIPIRLLFLPMILSHATRSIWSSRCWVFRKHWNKGARSMETQVKPHWYLDTEILLFCGKSLGGRGTWRGWSCLESILPYFQRITLMPNH